MSPINRYLDKALGPIVMCNGCQKKLREHQRRACPRCGGLTRTYYRDVFDTFGAKDKAS